MNPDRWTDIVAMVKEKFPVITEGTERPEEGPGQIEFIEFTGPLGTMRCEFGTRPKVSDKRGMGGHGVGRAVHYHYSDSETTTSFHVYRHVNGAWEEIDATMFT
jgi:hypothetical protein